MPFHTSFDLFLAAELKMCPLFILMSIYACLGNFVSYPVTYLGELKVRRSENLLSFC